MINYFKKTVNSGYSVIPFIAAWILPVIKGDIFSFAAMYFGTLIFLCGILARLGFEMLPLFLMYCINLLIFFYNSLSTWIELTFIPQIIDILIELLENINRKINKIIKKLKSKKR